MSQITKRALAASLKKLLQKKPLNKITISDISRDLGINRMTFYYHFKDIFDLIEWIFIDETARAIDGKKTYETWQQGFLQTFEMLLTNKPLILNVYHSISREKITEYLYAITYDLLIGVIEEKAVGLDITQENKNFIANFYSYAFVGLLLDWIKKDMKEDPKIISKQLDTLIHGDILRALKKFESSPNKKNLK